MTSSHPYAYTFPMTRKSLLAGTGADAWWYFINRLAEAQSKGLVPVEPDFFELDGKQQRAIWEAIEPGPATTPRETPKWAKQFESKTPWAWYCLLVAVGALCFIGSFEWALKTLAAAH